MPGLNRSTVRKNDLLKKFIGQLLTHTRMKKFSKKRTYQIQSQLGLFAYFNGKSLR